MKRALGRIVLAAGLAAIVGGVFTLSFYLAMRKQLRSTEVQIPDLGGMTIEEAGQVTESLELVLQVVGERHDPRIPSGRVLEQMPPAGASVRQGRKVKLVLSLGGKVLDVPDLVGKAAREVAIELRREGFVPGDEAHIHSYARAAGTVVAQVPPPGTPGVPGTRVHRLVSQGPPPPTWVMPDLGGLSSQEAERVLTLFGFRRGTVRRLPAAGRPAGTVVGQLPLAGYPIGSRDIVELTVAD